MKYRGKIIILDDCKFDWTPAQLNHARFLFERGVKPSKVAQIMNEKVIDIGLVYLHLLETKQYGQSKQSKIQAIT